MFLSFFFGGGEEEDLWGRSLESHISLLASCGISVTSVQCSMVLTLLCLPMLMDLSFLSHPTSASQYQVICLRQTLHFSVPVLGFFYVLLMRRCARTAVAKSFWALKCYEFLLFQQIVFH